MLTYALPLLGLAHIALAGMYPQGGAVKQISAAEWKKAMNEEVSLQGIKLPRHQITFLVL